MILYFASYTSAKGRVAFINNDNNTEYGLLTAFPEHSHSGHIKHAMKSNGHKIFMDSGAYSVFSGVNQIKIDDYIVFLIQYSHLFHLYANLDVIGDHEKTYRNQVYMEAHGLTPLPTFHYGSPYDLLDEMVKKYPYIGLGGLVPLASSKAKLSEHLRKAFNIIRLKTKVHGWGMTAPFILSRFPFFSVDSTAWLHGMKSNRVVQYNRKLLRLESFIPEFWTSQHYRIRDIQNCLAYLEMIKHMTCIWRSRGIDW